MMYPILFELTSSHEDTKFFTHNPHQKKKNEIERSREERTQDLKEEREREKKGERKGRKEGNILF